MKIYKAPLQDSYSGELPTQAKRKRMMKVVVVVMVVVVVLIMMSTAITDRSELEVVKAPVVKNEPSSLPRLTSTT